MRLIKLECPHCGASLEVNDGADRVTCTYCGKTFTLADDVTRTEHTVNIKDEAKLKEAQLKEQQYQDEKERQRSIREAEKQERYKRGFAGKFNILMIILCVLGAYTAFSGGHILAGVIAILQVALLVLARLLATGTLHTVKGFRIPPVILSLLALVLVFPYSSMLTTKKPEKLVWPSSGIASHIPDPDAEYGSIGYNYSFSFSAKAEKYTEEQFSDYAEACRKMGFTEDTQSPYEFEGYDAEGYTISLNYDGNDKAMTIEADAPLETTEFSWPLNDLVQELPAPPSLKGVIEKESNDEVELLLTGISAADAQEYMNAVKATSFGENYKLQDGNLTAADPEGNELTIRTEQFGRMSLEVKRYVEPEATSEPTAEPTPEATPEPAEEPTPEPTEETKAAVSGIRPEFQKTMDDYEAFYDQYIAFMQNYSQSSDPLSMMTDYMSLMSKAEEMERSLDNIDESELSDEEYKLYIDVTTRVANKLAKASVDMN